jgi:hypothetical protein
LAKGTEIEKRGDLHVGSMKSEVLFDRKIIGNCVYARQTVSA